MTVNGNNTNGSSNDATADDPRFLHRVSSAMNNPPRAPKFESKEQEREWLKFRLAQAFRIFAHHGFDDGVAGHITVRDPIIPNAFWVNPFGVHFAHITPDVLILVDHTGSIRPESGPIRNLNKAAFMIHSAIHSARPDVLCAAHTHSIYGRSFSTFGRELDMLSQNDCVFYDDHVCYNQFNGPVLDPEEGDRIAAALGPTKKAMILQNHGLLTVSNTIEGAVHLFIRFEESCKCQVLAYSGYASGVGSGGTAAMGGGKVGLQIVSNEEADQVHQLIGRPSNAWFSGLPEFNVLERREKGAFGVWNGPKTENILTA